MIYDPVEKINGILIEYGFDDTIHIYRAKYKDQTAHYFKSTVKENAYHACFEHCLTTTKRTNYKQGLRGKGSPVQIFAEEAEYIMSHIGPYPYYNSLKKKLIHLITRSVTQEEKKHDKRRKTKAVQAPFV